jgi:hypothetical protein
MFARNVSVNLKPGTLAEFTKTMENGNRSLKLMCFSMSRSRWVSGT